MPWQLPPRLWHRYHRQELKYADRLERARRHAAKADACDAAIRCIRKEAADRRPKQALLFPASTTDSAIE